VSLLEKEGRGRGREKRQGRGEKRWQRRVRQGRSISQNEGRRTQDGGRKQRTNGYVLIEKISSHSSIKKLPYRPFFAMSCGHPRLISTASQWGATTHAEVRSWAGSLAQNWTMRGRSPRASRVAWGRLLSGVGAEAEGGEEVVGKEGEEEEGRGVQGTGKVDGLEEDEGPYAPSSPEGMSKLLERYVLFVASTNICGASVSQWGHVVTGRNGGWDWEED
jgi:hypothetical protein